MFAGLIATNRWRFSVWAVESLTCWAVMTWIRGSIVGSLCLAAADVGHRSAEFAHGSLIGGGEDAAVGRIADTPNAARTHRLGVLDGRTVDTGGDLATIARRHDSVDGREDIRMPCLKWHTKRDGQVATADLDNIDRPSSKNRVHGGDTLTALDLNDHHRLCIDRGLQRSPGSCAVVGCRAQRRGATTTLRGVADPLGETAD